MLYSAAVFLTALTFAFLAYATDRKANYTIAALLAGGAWLFGATGVLICAALVLAMTRSARPEAPSTLVILAIRVLGPLPSQGYRSKPARLFRATPAIRIGQSRRRARSAGQGWGR
jgi:hypothetical protein